MSRRLLSTPSTEDENRLGSPVISLSNTSETVSSEEECIVDFQEEIRKENKERTAVHEEQHSDMTIDNLENVSSNILEKSLHNDRYRCSTIEDEEWGLYKLPYISSYNRKLKNEEVLSLILSDKERATRCPQSCRRNAVFLIDSAKLGHPDDVQSDLNGVFSNCKEIKNFTTKLCEQNGKKYVKVLSKKKLPLKDDQWHFRVHRVANSHGLNRNIFYFYNASC